MKSDSQTDDPTAIKVRALISSGNEYLAKRHHWRSITDYDAALKLDSLSSEAFTGRAKAYLHLRQLDKAFSDFQRALDIEPNSETYNTRGVIYQERKKHGLAISDFSKAIELNPDEPEAYNNRGYSYVEKGKYELKETSIVKTFYANTKMLILKTIQSQEKLGLVTHQSLLRVINLRIADDRTGGTGNRYRNWRSFGYKSFREFLEDLPEVEILNVTLFDEYEVKLKSENNPFKGWVDFTPPNVVDPRPLFSKAIEDYDVVIAINPDYIEAYKNRAVAHKLVGIKESADRDLRTAGELIEAQVQAQASEGGELTYRSAKLLGWKVLPPGFWRIPARREEIRSEFKYRQDFDDFIERLDYVDSSRPREIYGSQFSESGSRYFLFLFKDHVVAECPEFGNAAYVLKGLKDWENIFKKSKWELRNDFKGRVVVVNHSTGWKRRLRAYLN